MSSFKMPAVIYAGNVKSAGARGFSGCAWGTGKKYIQRHNREPGGLYYSQKIVRRIQAENAYMRNRVESVERTEVALRNFIEVLEGEVEKAHKAIDEITAFSDEKQRFIAALWDRIDAYRR